MGRGGGEEGRRGRGGGEEGRRGGGRRGRGGGGRERYIHVRWKREINVHIYTSANLASTIGRVHVMMEQRENKYV